MTAPIVTAAGDMVTLPALFLATYLVGIPWLTPIVAILCARRRARRARRQRARSAYPILRRIVRESLPVLVLAGTIDVIAGLTIEKRFESFLVYPALLVLVPPFLEDSGALGEHPQRAGVDQAAPRHARCPGRWSLRVDRRGLPPGVHVRGPVFFLLGVSADIAALVVGLEEPGQPGDDRGRRCSRGCSRPRSRCSSGFYGAVAAYRLGLDPDNHGIPIVTSSLDLLGARRADPRDRRARL